MSKDNGKGDTAEPAEPRPAAPKRRARARARIPQESNDPAPKAADLFTEEQLKEFLDATRKGIGRHLAAEAIGTTGSHMKSLCRPERDPEFAAAYEEARAEGQEFYRERLQAQARKMATDPKVPNARILEVELGTHVPGYEHLRRDKMTHDGIVLHEHTLVIDLTKLEGLSTEELEQAREALALLRPDADGQGQLRAIEAA